MPRREVPERGLGADEDAFRPAAGLTTAYAELVARSLTVPTVAKCLGVDSSRVRRRIYARSLYAFKHRGAWFVPKFQLDGRNLLGGLERVVHELSPDLHPVAVSRWLTRPSPELQLGGRAVSPIAWLASGGPTPPVAELAGDLDQP